MHRCSWHEQKPEFRLWAGQSQELAFGAWYGLQWSYWHVEHFSYLYKCRKDSFHGLAYSDSPGPMNSNTHGAGLNSGISYSYTLWYNTRLKNKKPHSLINIIEVHYRWRRHGHKQSIQRILFSFGITINRIIFLGLLIHGKDRLCWYLLWVFYRHIGTRTYGWLI